MTNDVTDVWKLYEDGKEYIDKLNMVNQSTQAYRFYEGDHWKGLESGEEKMPIVEIIKPIVDYKISQITQNNLQAVYTSMNYDASDAERQALTDICDKLGNHFRKYWENQSMDTVLYDIVKYAIISGEHHAYFYFGQNEKKQNGAFVPGEIHIDLVDNCNVMFGDEQEIDVQKQPYILTVFRRNVDEVKKEAEANGIKAEDIANIVSDDDKDLQTGYAEEVENKRKCLCVMKLFKQDGKVHIIKSTKNVIYQKDTDTQMTLYPFASYVWERKKGSRRGVSDVYKYIPNQLWVNKVQAFRLISVRQTAFPKLVYSTDVVNGKDIDVVGAAIEVQSGESTQSATQMVGYINPAQMSADAKYVLDELMSYTKESAGASDVALGNTKADNYSAILAVQEANAAPLKRQTESLKRFVEDIARILFDMWCTYYPNGFEMRYDETVGNQKIERAEMIPQEILRNMKIQTKVDITPVSPFNRLTEQQKADNLLSAGIVSIDEYVKLLPDDEPMKSKLEDILFDRQQQQMQQQTDMDVITQQQQALDEASTAYVAKEAELMEKNAQVDAARNEGYAEGAVAAAASKKEDKK